MVLVVMEKLWVGPVAKIMVGVQNALPIIQQCVLSLYVLLEDLIIVVTLRMDAMITEEYGHAENPVGFYRSQTMNMGTEKKIDIIITTQIFIFSYLACEDISPDCEKQKSQCQLSCKVCTIPGEYLQQINTQYMIRK